MNLLKRYKFLWTFVPCLILAGGCAHRPPETTLDSKPEAFTFESKERQPVKPEWLKPSGEPYTLGPGDRVEIEVIGEPATQTLAPVGPDGKIYFYSLPGMDVTGMTPSEVRIQLESGLETFFREQPSVSVIPRKIVSRKVWLLGRLDTPGVYPLEGPTTLLEAIANAGGPEASSVFVRGSGFTPGADEAADLERSFVMRDGEVLPVDVSRLLLEGDMSQNIYLQSDDLVYLPSAGATDIHVLGAVFEPKAVRFTDQITLVGAITSAMGPTRDAHLTQVAVLRGGTGDPRIVVFDLNEIINGDRSDIRLEPNDVVYVPLSPQRHIDRYVDTILSSFGRTIGINLGARALPVDDGSGASISIPIETLQ